MTRTASAAMLAHIAGESTTLCTVWKITRLDGQVFRFTDHDRPLEVDGEIYLASTAGMVSAHETSSQLNVDNAEVRGFFESSAITEDDVIAGAWDFADVRVTLVNWQDTTQQLKIRRGYLGEVNIGNGDYTVELRGMMQRLQEQHGRVYTALCDADLGDARCGIDLDVFTDGKVSTTVTTVTNNRLFTATALTQATGWFDGGRVNFTGGNNAGLWMEVKTSTDAGVITLQEPMPRAIVASDAFTIYAGCRKRFNEDCIAKFANAINYRGFPHVPGLDRVKSGT